jgi:hypothetical protein
LVDSEDPKHKSATDELNSLVRTKWRCANLITSGNRCQIRIRVNACG